MRVKSLSAVNITRKLHILLFLLLIMPTLVVGYMVSQYIIYAGFNKLDVFRLNLILVLTFILSLAGFSLVKDLLSPFEKLKLWAREIQKGNICANFFEKRDDEIGELFSFFEDLTKKMRKEYETVKELSITDELTGVYNYRYFQERVSEEIARAKRYSRELSLVMFDLDYFKRYNDTFGHSAGNSALRRVAEIIKTHSRTGDIIFRYGGEEFMSILPETRADQAVIYTQRICNLVAEEKFIALPSDPSSKGFSKVCPSGLVDGKAYPVGKSLPSMDRKDYPLDNATGRITISAGIAQYNPSQELVSDVDKALYAAKLNGRNQVVVSGGPVDSKVEEIASLRSQ